jgi:hypothetical protein
VNVSSGSTAVSPRTGTAIERKGWEQAAAHYDRCWTDTGLLVEPLVDATDRGAALRGGASAGVHTGAILRAQPAGRLEAIRTAIVDGVRRYADEGGFTLPLVARAISAQTDS